MIHEYDLWQRLQADDVKEYTEFLRELTALTVKHGIMIGGCGCCGSPWLTGAPENADAGFYAAQMGESLKFFHPSDKYGWDRRPGVEEARET